MAEEIEVQRKVEVLAIQSRKTRKEELQNELAIRDEWVEYIQKQVDKLKEQNTQLQAQLKEQKEIIENGGDE